MIPIDLDDLAAAFTQNRDRAEGFPSSTHAGVAAVAAAIAHHLLDGLRAQNLSPEQFRMRAVEALIQLGAMDKGRLRREQALGIDDDRIERLSRRLVEQVDTWHQKQVDSLFRRGESSDIQQEEAVHDC